MIKLKAVILAAGEGRRCRPLTQTRSKVMLPVGNRPFMEHVIRALAANDVKELCIVVGYQKERIMDHFEDGIKYGARITYIEQKKILGTAHALAQAEPYMDGEFIVVNGDNLFDDKAIRDLITSNGDYCILAALREHTGDYGVLTVEQDKVVSIREKPGRPCAGILNTGAYKFATDIFDELPKTPISERGSYELTQTLLQMIKDGLEIKSVLTKGIWADAIFAWDLLNANSLAMNIRKPKISGEIEEGARVRGEVEIGAGTVVRSGSYLVGPVSIGKNCDIGPNATILPATSIGDSVRIGSSSEIRNSIIMNGTRIGSAAVISDSAIGASCVIGDQAILESGDAIVEVEDEFHRAEFGSIIADNVIIGSRGMLNPGTVLETDARIGSGVVVRGWVERGSRVI
ncbi:MAG: bifunctional sugar-1-phosphate nucleotidylyltransferase/acetyltransferase [Methanotrichaceae archaeon]